MPKNIPKKDNKFLAYSIIALMVIGFFFWASKPQTGETNLVLDQNPSAPYPELKDFQSAKLSSSFVELSKYFKELADRKGAKYAFDVLLVAPLGPNIDMHLLGHTVGDVLYKQQGINGIKICTQDFRNACSHSIVVGLLLEKGEGVIPKIAETCKQAPGGSGAYTMCFHGLGHGVLAYTGYDMPKAVQLCDRTGTREYNDREAIECMGGTVMEIIGGGFHNQALWAVQSKKYLPESDPLSPCNSDYMPEKAKVQCYLYLTPHLFIVAGGQRALGSPTPEDFQKAFTFCNKIPASETVNRNACYGGFGKEFIALANNRDIRDVDKMTEEQMFLVYEWCSLSDDPSGVPPCISNAMNSLYWGGENDRNGAIRLCSVIPNKSLKDICFGDLTGAVNYYVKDSAYRESFCKDIPSEYGDICRSRLLSQ